MRYLEVFNDFYYSSINVANLWRSSPFTLLYYHLPQILSLFKYNLEDIFAYQEKSENAEANLNTTGFYLFLEIA